MAMLTLGVTSILTTTLAQDPLITGSLLGTTLTPVFIPGGTVVTTLAPVLGDISSADSGWGPGSSSGSELDPPTWTDPIFGYKNYTWQWITFFAVLGCCVFCCFCCVCLCLYYFLAPTKRNRGVAPMYGSPGGQGHYLAQEEQMPLTGSAIEELQGMGGYGVTYYPH
mmetsp:Transcript_18988/g.30850  ORF Transcript_18988/g.30850 Transcript_18988/m.30850 type:complete len:167 (-) Transcript_18988:115-615(-)